MEKSQPVIIPNIQPVNQTKNRWIWVRRFVMSLVLVAAAMYLLAPSQLSQLWFEQGNKNDKKEYVVLQSGFPQMDNMTGLAMKDRTAAAIAFSPRPVKTQQQQQQQEEEEEEGFSSRSILGSGESWWDRIFHRGHVHLKNVQLPVLSRQLQSVEAVLSICTTTHDRFWQNVPDTMHCIASIQTKADPEAVAENGEESLGVIEWTPSNVIVLKKRQVYWLVVQSMGSEAFTWVSAQDGVDPWGSAQQTSHDNWKLFSKNEPVLCAMATVTEH
ncbi:hypothetical protein EC973_007513 [Apophysomyces ossiformis]|uniref:Uncharacterized protein n=1 Tax=Apophysomyces ossiformis TaxID=679940 RepID=A0A8H7BPP3_9FUNG|nr:hypothetical protein EC973_007513 [Apophysomyces ossiformis]